MISKTKKFLSDSERIVFDRKHRNTIRFNISKYQVSVEAGKKRFSALEDAKSRAAVVKRYVVEHLSSYLEEFEERATANGIEVLWAEDEDEAIMHIKNVIVSEKIKKVVKSKSMTSEEIAFNEVFGDLGVECVETDLGEFIVQNAGEKPYHILTPAMHKSRGDVAQLFNRLFGTSTEATASEMTSFVKGVLRSQFESAEMGLTGANFLLAREGAIALTENEGNGLFSVSYPRVHVVLAGIEKILPSVEYLDLFWPLLALHGTGQRLTAYNSVISGPANESELNGPQRMVIVLLDNGRTNLYQKKYQSESLACIRCGACLNACPVYKNVGGYTYNAVYSGPIGSVIMPHLKPNDDYSHLSFASSLCGACYDVCPVKINLPELLLRNRRDTVEGAKKYVGSSLLMKSLSAVLKNPRYISHINFKIQSFLFSLFMKKGFGKQRDVPTIDKSSFQSQWKNHQIKH
ncbi:LUD domain-containing protein [Alkaliflexus imshenetskii]|uniref:LUD domain-containing protein n=1 Tax=Alkaliflexus imshenetskii TaxID=286730 RepID=UPI00047C0F74|nr:LUD domain-containing protein [Alkaliflexus imshenetskii]